MAFTTWSDLETKMKDDLAKNKWHVSSYTIRNRTTTYTSFAEFKEALDYVCRKASEERGDFCRRTYVV